ncbi:unnamed protein product, partial [Ectocarpus sp. 8 AP-2014]
MCEVEGVRVDGVGCTSFAAFKPALDVGNFSIPEDWCKSPGSDETDPPGDADGTTGSDDSGSAAAHTDGDDDACSDDERTDDRTKGRAAEEAARREELGVVRWSRRRGERMCHPAKGTVREAGLVVRRGHKQRSPSSSRTRGERAAVRSLRWPTRLRR